MGHEIAINAARERTELVAFVEWEEHVCFAQIGQYGSVGCLEVVGIVVHRRSALTAKMKSNMSMWASLICPSVARR